MMQNIEINEQQLSAKLSEIAGRISKRVSQTAYDVGQDLIRAKELLPAWRMVTVPGTGRYQ